MFDRANFADTCPQRANVIEWLPFEKGQSVVIHSSAPSAVIDMLRDKEVQLQVLSDTQVEKLAANPGKGSLDYVIVLGMEVDAKFLAGLYRKVKPEGHLVALHVGGMPKGILKIDNKLYIGDYLKGRVIVIEDEAIKKIIAIESEPNAMILF